jgi:hypothetical protein
LGTLLHVFYLIQVCDDCRGDIKQMKELIRWIFKLYSLTINIFMSTFYWGNCSTPARKQKCALIVT